MNETVDALAQLLHLDQIDSSAFRIIADSEHKYLRDLKINTSNALSFDKLNEKERLMLALAVAINEKNKRAEESLLKKTELAGITLAEIADVYSCVSLLNINNVFYRFRHFTQKEVYQTTPAGIRMSIIMNPVIGKEFFELLSLSVSALNGCEMCVRSHEESLIKMGTEPLRIFDAIRLAAILKGTLILL